MSQPSFPNHSYNVDPALDHRRADAWLTVRTSTGELLADTAVTVAQRSHKFLFGCIGFDFIELANDELSGAQAEAAQQLADAWFELFNFATLPFYWGNFEPVRGRPDTARILKTAKWFADRGAVVKGHPLAWHTVTAPWLRDLSSAEIAAVQSDRVTREVTDFRGVIDMWDVINEVVIMPIFDKDDNGITRMCRDFGRLGTIRMVFDRARAANPTATLLLNDFDMSSAFECLIEGCIGAGIAIDAIGLQSHMHQGYWGEDKTLETIDRFARYGLPIHFTESTLLSGHLMPPDIVDLNDYQIAEWPSTPEGEARQADEMVRHYRTLLSHPAVEAITYWGITDIGAWLNAPVGLVRADGTPKPAVDAMRDLVKGQWWLAPTPMTTDGEGRLQVRGFLGGYEISASGRSGGFDLTQPGATNLEVSLSAG
jgi:endo-1,4-beta-xylanase